MPATALRGTGLLRSLRKACALSCASPSTAESGLERTSLRPHRNLHRARSCRRGQNKDHGLGDIVGLNHFAPIQLAIWRNQRCINKPWQNHSHLDAMLPNFFVKRLREPDETELRG